MRQLGKLLLLRCANVGKLLQDIVLPVFENRNFAAGCQKGDLIMKTDDAT